MIYLEKFLNARLVKAYLLTNVVLANLHVGIVVAYSLWTGRRDQANLFHLLGMHLVFPILREERYLIASFLVVGMLIASMFWLAKHVRLSLKG